MPTPPNLTAGLDQMYKAVDELADAAQTKIDEMGVADAAWGMLLEIRRLAFIGIDPGFLLLAAVLRLAELRRTGGEPT
jgi:hypothetical protein